MQGEAREMREARIYRIVVGVWCFSLITFGLLGLLDVINIHS
jgi:hypothetical protein